MFQRKISNSFKKFDAYAKPLDDFKVKTFAGGAVTIISSIIIIFLFISEFLDYRTVHMEPLLTVDKSRKERMTIYMNITFPHMPCYLLSVDVMDVAGEQQNDIEHDVYKTRLDSEGYVIESEASFVGESEIEGDQDSELPPNYCGSCYGARRGCCNTCDEVKEAYAAKGWSFNSPGKVEQCVREGYGDKIEEQKNEGCNVHGVVKVNKVAGNFHFAPGKSYQQNGMHVHDLQQFFKSTDFDFTHTIHSISFGEHQERIFNPLDNTKKETKISRFQFQYFLKVVSTNTVYLNGIQEPSNQYSVTEHDQDFSIGSGTYGLPGVFFNYEISPMLVTYTETRKSFTSFLTGVCAIIGGVFTVAGMIDSFIYSAEKRLKKKIELGKAS